MRTKNLCIMLCATVLMTGCENLKTPEGQLWSAQKSFIAIEDSLTTAVETGLIHNDNDVQRIDSLLKTGRTLLDNWHAGLLAGRETTDYQREFVIVIDELEKLKPKG